MNDDFRGAVQGAPRLILRFEGSVLAAGAAFFYWRLGGSWVLFAILILAPDLAFLAYLASPRAGSVIYNAVHTTILPLALLMLGALLGVQMAEHIALIWLAHVGVDRAFGYGLKYQTGFADTHLGRIGRFREPR